MKPFVLLKLTLTILILCVLGQVSESAAGELGSLFWGVEPRTGQPWRKEHIQTLLAKEPNHLVSKRLRRFFTLAREGINAKISPVEKLEFEGIVFSDPRYKKSSEAVKDFRLILSWAMSGAFEGGEIGNQYIQKAQEGIRAWVNTCRPDGNPINQNHFIPLLCAIDVVQSTLNPEDQTRTGEWLGKILSLGDKHFESQKSSATVLVNNHKTWHLAVRGMVARMMKNKDEIQKTRELFNRYVMKNLNVNGTSFDFSQRDALHYHVYNLEAYVYYLIFTKKNLSTEGQDRVFRALGVLKPYFLGEKQHLEFVKTTVKFDVTRKEANDPHFQNKPWEPERARKLLRLSRILYKEKSDFNKWTRNVVDEDYDPFIKLLTALHGGE